MKVQYTTEDGRLSVEVEGDTAKDVFKQLAEFQEIFEDRTCVAKIKDKIIKTDKVLFVVRVVDGDEYYEMKCVDWDSGLFGFKKSFGQNKKGGGLFPKQMPEENRIPGLNGWHKYLKPGDGSNDESSPAPKKQEEKGSKAATKTETKKPAVDDDIPF